MRTSIALLFALSLLCAGCNRDYFSEVEADCKKSADQCGKAVYELLPFNDETFETEEALLRPWLRQKIADAFAAIVLYPIKLPPQNRILGAAPWSIAKWQLDIIKEDSNPNKALFNHMMNLVGEIVFHKKDETDHHSAFMHVTWTLEGQLIIQENATYPGEHPTHLAATLVHEARHADGYFHVACKTDNLKDPKTMVPYEDCDNDLSGPIGFALVYEDMLVRGSWRLLQEGELVAHAQEACRHLKDGYILRMPPELAKLIAGMDCWDIDRDWLIEHEGLQP